MEAKTMVFNIDQHKLMKNVMEFGNACVSTIAFTLIFISLIFYYFNILDLVHEANFILVMLFIFTLDQVLLKPIFSRIGKKTS